MKYALGDIANIVNGFPFRGRISNDPAGDIAVLAIKDVSAHESPAEAELPRVHSSELNGVDRYKLTEGDVAFQSRGYKNEACVIAGPMNAIAAQGVYMIRAKPEYVSGAFLAWYLNHENCQRQLQAFAQGTQIPLIPLREFADLTIEVPKAEVQAQIVRITAARHHQKRLQAMLDQTTDQLIDALCWQQLKQPK